MALELAVDGGERAGRWQAIDVARGAAIAAMVVYHLAWDLSFLRLITADIVGDPAWQAAARAIAGSFLALSGIGLVLAHGERFRAWAFLRRLAVVAGAAAGVTLATWVALPDSYIFFGVLHCIALSSVLALPFLRAPVWLAGAAALACLAAPLALAGPAFDDPALAFLGLGSRAPVTNDYVPVFPWLGLVLAGVALARIAKPGAIRAGLPNWRAQKALPRALAWSGRHSLPIYLVHQPILLGALYLAAPLVRPDPLAESAPFLAHCRAACREGGIEEGLCRAACACVAKNFAVEDPRSMVGRSTARDQARLEPIARSCFERIRPSPDESRSPDAGPNDDRRP